MMALCFLEGRAMIYLKLLEAKGIGISGMYEKRNMSIKDWRKLIYVEGRSQKLGWYGEVPNNKEVEDYHNFL